MASEVLTQTYNRQRQTQDKNKLTKDRRKNLPQSFQSGLKL